MKRCARCGQWSDFLPFVRNLPPGERACGNCYQLLKDTIREVLEQLRSPSLPTREEVILLARNIYTRVFYGVQEDQISPLLH